MKDRQITKSKHILLLIVFAGIIVAIMIFLGWFLSQKYRQNDADVEKGIEDEQITEANGIGTWKTYENEIPGLTFKYPANWVVMKDVYSEIDGQLTAEIIVGDNNGNEFRVNITDGEPWICAFSDTDLGAVTAENKEYQEYDTSSAIFRGNDTFRLATKNPGEIEVCIKNPKTAGLYLSFTEFGHISCKYPEGQFTKETQDTFHTIIKSLARIEN